MASPRSAPLEPAPRLSTFLMVGMLPLAAGAAGWWFRGPTWAVIAAAAVAAGGLAWLRSHAASRHRGGEGTVELKPGVSTGADARTRAAVMDGGTRVGVVPAGRSARGHRDRDL